MKTILAGWLMLAVFGVQAAKTAYVTDELEVLLRSGQGSQYRILSSLKTGTPLTILKNDSGDGWAYVKTEDRKTGWVLSRYLTDSPTARLKLEAATKNLDSLQQENREVKEELTALKAGKQTSAAEHEALIKEKNQLIQELASIRQASSEAVKIMEERDQLRERVINLERGLQTIKRENKTLADSTAQDWFLIGAGVLLGGMLIGLILPKLSWQRKSRSWDSF